MTDKVVILVEDGGLKIEVLGDNNDMDYEQDNSDMEDNIDMGHVTEEKEDMGNKKQNGCIRKTNNLPNKRPMIFISCPPAPSNRDVVCSTLGDLSS